MKRIAGTGNTKEIALEYFDNRRAEMLMQTPNVKLASITIEHGENGYTVAQEYNEVK